MTEDNVKSNLQTEAVKIVTILIEIGQPKDPSDVPKWLKEVKLLQMVLSDCWQSDPSGKLMASCLNIIYVVISTNLVPVGPAVWSVLDLVEEEKISEFVEEIFEDPLRSDNIKVKNMLMAMIEGLGQCGPYTPRLQYWIAAMVKALEARKNYSVLIEVAENEIGKLMQLLMIPLYRSSIYPTFRQFLYPVVTPHVFYKIINEVPAALNLLQKDLNDGERKLISLDFAGLIKVLLIRFPPAPKYETIYNCIRLGLMKFSETNFTSDSMILWDQDDASESSGWGGHNVNNESSSGFPQMPYKGLMNQGNTCYMNSVLQILYMTTRFRKELLQKEINPNEKAACDLQQLFAFMQESNRRVLVPNGVIHSTLPATFRTGHQQDSSEYLIPKFGEGTNFRYLLDILHEGESKMSRKRTQSTASEPENEKGGNGDFEEDSHTLKTSEENTVVERLFGGVTVSTTTCSVCRRAFPKTERFRNLYLPVPDDHHSHDLQELIDASLHPEELTNENAYDCENCETKRNATRRHAIVKAPEHLILTLKLFRFDSVKKQRMKLQSRLKNIKSVQLPVYNASQSQTHPIKYDLKAVVFHSGTSLDGGHYFSSAVDQTGQWYTFNDSVVSSAKYEWNASGGTPYLLILRQSDICDPPETPLPSNLKRLVHIDNLKFLTERKFQQRTFQRRRDYDDDRDDRPPNNGSLGGPGPPLVF